MGVGQPDSDKWVQGLKLGGRGKEGQLLQREALQYGWPDSHLPLDQGNGLHSPRQCPLEQRPTLKKGYFPTSIGQAGRENPLASPPTLPTGEDKDAPL